MNLKIVDKENFISNFISPISRVADSGILKLTSDKLTCLVSAADDTIIVYGEYKDCFETVLAPTSLNIPDFKKFVKLLKLVEEDLDLKIDTNSISYTSESLRFKTHLFDDGIISSPTLNMSKLSTINFDGNFTLSQECINNLLKGSTLSTEINKVYLNFENGNIQAEITDKSRDNVDSFAINISKNYTGTPITNSIPINFEIIRLLSASKLLQFNVKLASNLNIFNFELISEKITLNYIVSALNN